MAIPILSDITLSGNITLPVTGTNTGDPSGVGVLYIGNTNNRIFNDASGGSLRIEGSDNTYLEGSNIYIRKSDGDKFFQAGDSGVSLFYQDSEKLITKTTGIAVAGTLTTTVDVLATGSVKCTQNFRRTVTTATNASNTHTCTLVDNDNFNIAAANAATTIALVVATENIGQSGVITITNPASVGSLSFVALPSYMLTPDGATISFNATANAIAVISYYVVATDKVLCNYVGNFS